MENTKCDWNQAAREYFHSSVHHCKLFHNPHQLRQVSAVLVAHSPYIPMCCDSNAIHLPSNVSFNTSLAVYPPSVQLSLIFSFFDECLVFLILLHGNGSVTFLVMDDFPYLNHNRILIYIQRCWLASQFRARVEHSAHWACSVIRQAYYWSVCKLNPSFQGNLS